MPKEPLKKQLHVSANILCRGHSTLPLWLICRTVGEILSRGTVLNAYRPVGGQYTVPTGMQGTVLGVFMNEGDSYLQCFNGQY